MGFVTGFTGGVTLTLSLAYLSTVLHQRNRERQGQSLRAQAFAIQSLIDPIPEPLPPTRSEVASAKRAEAVEVAKERWNEEVENAVRWVQHTDWHEVREGVEDRIAALWNKAFGESIGDSTEKAKAEADAAVRTATAAADSAGSSILSRARGAFSRSKETTEDLGAKVQDKALQTKLAAWREEQHISNIARGKAAEAQGTVANALEKGKDKVAEAAGKVKSAVGLSANAALATANDGALTDVQRVLDQRFHTRQDRRTVAQVLQERYKLVDKRENNVLRGL